MLAVTTAVYGRVSDLVGVRAPLLAGLVLMSVGALVAALAPSYGALLAARVLQGAGAAAVPTLGVTILSHRYEGSVRGLAFGRLAGTAAAVSCLGPLAGGVVEAAFGWRAVMALPILGILVVPFLWRALHAGGSGAALDIVGAVLVALTAAGMVLLVQSPSAGIAVAVIGAGLLVLGVPAVRAQVRRRPAGFLPVEVVRNSLVVRSAIAAAAVPASWFAMLIALPAVLLSDGWEAWQVGLAMVPSAAVGSASTRSCTRWWVFHAQRTTYSGSVRIRHGPGSRLPFQSSSWRTHRRIVRVVTCRITRARGRSSHTTRSARRASSGRTVEYCHSVTHDGSAVKASTSVSKVGRFSQPAPWCSASISTWGMPSTAPTAAARVVLPDPDPPPTRTRCGREGSAASYGSRGIPTARPCGPAR